MNDLPDSLRWRVRFGQIFADRLERRGLDLRDWLWFHPDETDLRAKDPSVFRQVDLRRSRKNWENWFAPEVRQPVADLEGEALPRLRKQFDILLVGGLGSHLVRSVCFGDVAELNGDPKWMRRIDYGNTLSANDECAARAAEVCRPLIERARESNRKILFWGHSKGVLIILELISNSIYSDIAGQTAGVVSFAGAIGGSPAADSLLGSALQGAEGLRNTLRAGLRRVKSIVRPGHDNRIMSELPTFADLPDGIRDLSRERRRAQLERTHWPSHIDLFSLAGAVDPDHSRPLNRFLPNDVGRWAFHLTGYNLWRHGALHDTQVLLGDARWPLESRGVHLGTLRCDHWGMTYNRLLSRMPPDPTPRIPLYEAVVLVLDEYLRERTSGTKKGDG